MEAYVVKAVPAVDEAGEQVLAGVLLHEVKPPGPVDAACHLPPHREFPVTQVHDGAVLLRDRQHLGLPQGSQVPGLSAALGIEDGPVQADGPAAGSRMAAGDQGGEAA